ncbi:MAG: hypothetical protein ABI947_27175, partial [Chloroflexota bacterium]
GIFLPCKPFPSYCRVTRKKLPFDLKANRVIPYNPTADQEWESHLKERVRATLQELVEQNVTSFHQVWKKLKTPAEEAFDILNRHGSNRTFAIDVMDKLEPTPADEFFEIGSEKENSVLKKAKSDLWLIYETGSTIFNVGEIIIRSFLENGGNLRLLLVNEKIQDFVLNRHRLGHQNPDYLVQRYRQTEFILKRMKEELRTRLHSSQIEVRRLPFPLSFVGVYADPTSPIEQNRYCAIRFIEYRSHIEDERSVVMRGDLSAITFAHYVKQFNNMWDAASPDESV